MVGEWQYGLLNCLMTCVFALLLILYHVSYSMSNTTFLMSYSNWAWWVSGDTDYVTVSMT